MDKYILDGHIPVICNELMKWARWFETANRRVKKTKIGETEISTVFLGLDLQYGKGKPLIFETMIFGGKLDGEADRYSTWEEAEKGHKKMIEEVKQAEENNAPANH